MSYIVYFARTPVEVKEDEDGEDQDEEEEEEIQNLQQVDPEWVMEHAKQGILKFRFTFESSPKLYSSKKSIQSQKILLLPLTQCYCSTRFLDKISMRSNRAVEIYEQFMHSEIRSFSSFCYASRRNSGSGCVLCRPAEL